jgi:hypothetical protein
LSAKNSIVAATAANGVCIPTILTAIQQHHLKVVSGWGEKIKHIKSTAQALPACNPVE